MKKTTSFLMQQMGVVQEVRHIQVKTYLGLDARVQEEMDTLLECTE